MRCMYSDVADIAHVDELDGAAGAQRRPSFSRKRDKLYRCAGMDLSVMSAANKLFAQHRMTKTLPVAAQKRYILQCC